MENNFVCSTHFSSGQRYGSNNILAIFPTLEPKSGEIVWPIDISHLLEEKTSNDKENQRNSSETVPVVVESSSTTAATNECATEVGAVAMWMPEGDRPFIKACKRTRRAQRSGKVWSY